MVHGAPPAVWCVPLPTSSPLAPVQEPVLTTADGQKIAQSEAIARYGAPPASAASRRLPCLRSMLPSCARSGCTVNTPHASLCAVATTGGAANLYPASSAAAIDGWLAIAAGIETAAAAWCQPTCGAATPEQRAAARQQLEASLAQLEGALASSAYLAGAAPTIADVAALSALLPLYQEVLGQDVQQQYAAVTRWLQACATQPQFAAVLGELLLRVALSCD